MNASISSSLRIGACGLVLKVLTALGMPSLAHGQLLPIEGIEIIEVGYVNPDYPDELSVLLHVTECYSVGGHFGDISTGNLLELTRNGGEFEMRIDFSPFDTGFPPCVPTPPYFTHRVIPGGNLIESGTYSLQLIGIQTSNNTAYDLGNFVFSISSAPRRIPSNTKLVLAGLAAMLGALAWLTIKRRAA